MKRLAVILLLLAACGKPSAEVKQYTIRSGNHYCTPREVRMLSESLSFEFYVDDTWRYEVDKQGINKICGISDGENHMNNSIRLGWMDNNGTLEAYAYAYNGTGKHVAKKVCNIATGWHTAEVGMTTDVYYVSVDGDCQFITRNNKSDIHMMLYPYFGGQCVAPHDINIKFKFQ